MIISLKDIRELTRRASGRTSEIEHVVFHFLSAPQPDPKKVMVVVCHNEAVTDEYVKFLHHINERHDFLDRLDRGKAVSKYGQMVMFLDNDYAHRLQGIRIEDVLFDTPEYNLFSSPQIFELMSRML